MFNSITEMYKVSFVPDGLPEKLCLYSDTTLASVVQLICQAFKRIVLYVPF